MGVERQPTSKIGNKGVYSIVVIHYYKNVEAGYKYMMTVFDILDGRLKDSLSAAVVQCSLVTREIPFKD